MAESGGRWRAFVEVSWTELQGADLCREVARGKQQWQASESAAGQAAEKRPCMGHLYTCKKQGRLII